MGHFFRFLFSKIFVINLLIVFALLAGGLYAVLSYLDDYTRHDEILVVPNLLGMHVSEVEELLLEDNKFSSEISDSIYKKGVDGGIVVEQSPLAEKSVKEGRKIYLTVAAHHPPRITMPNLVDQSLRQATSLMETYGIEIGQLTYKPDLCTNCILEQTVDGVKIEAGSKIREGSIVDLTVGQGLGNELTDVPYLVDFNVDMAQALLQSKSLNLGALLYDETIETAEDSLNAKVYKHMPFYSEEPTVRMGTSIYLFLTLDTNKVVHTVKEPNDSL
ncbi:MAG: PASTA domain-containing protein [Flavobacteriales bacterium]|nr:PASTA domain-containing protein [Flavobacteriales bacterium]